MKAWLPTLALFGWHNTGMADDREAVGVLIRLVWRDRVVELGIGRVLP